MTKKVQSEPMGKARTYSMSSSIDSACSTPAQTPHMMYAKTPNQDNITIFDLLDPSLLSLDLKKRKDETYNWVKGVYKRRSSFKSSGYDEIDRLKQKMHKSIDKAYVRIDKVQNRSSTEKLFFSLSVYFIFLMGFMVGNYPQYVHITYTIVMAVLIPIRYITYYKNGNGYFLADLCYYVNFLLLLYIWVFPNSQKLFITCCSFSWGTVSFAVITWKNKLVLHSIDKITSTAIHVLPGVIMYVITHQLSFEYKSQRFPGCVRLAQWNFWNGIFYTSIMYFIWQLGYHYFITIRKAEKIKNGRITSFEYLRKAFATKPIGRFVNSLPEPFPVVAFTFIQYGYQLCTMSLCPLLYKYKIFCSLFVSFIFMTSVYNGATYYVDFYGKKFQKEVVRLQKEIEELNSGSEKLSDPAATSSISSSGQPQLNIEKEEMKPVSISDIIES